MGRADFKIRPKRGPGRKSKKQGDPSLPKHLKLPEENTGQLSANQKRKLKRKLAKETNKKPVLKCVPAETVPEKRKKLDLDFGSDDDDEGEQFLLEDDEDDEEMVMHDEVEDKLMDVDEAADDEDVDSDSGVDVELGNTRTDEDSFVPADLEALDERIQSHLKLLNDFKKLAKPGQVRSQILDQTLRFLRQRFSYNEFLLGKFYHLYPKDILDFLQANEVDRPVTIRTNTLKTRRRDLAQALIGRGVNLDPLGGWTKVGLVVYESQVPLGATPEYLAGHYLLQGASSMLPVVALCPKPDERVLDMCAAPGGKTTYLGQFLKNTGVLYANDVNKTRAKAVVGNCHRMGIHNVVVSSLDGRELSKYVKNFDRVLLDAPCSGTGIISKDPSVKTGKTEQDVERCSHLQKQLILEGIDCCKVGGVLVYSTCSVLVEENESVVNYALRKRCVRLLECGISFGDKGFAQFQGRRFHPSLTKTRRYTPHEHNMDGFFVAKLVKLEKNKPAEEKRKTSDKIKSSEVQETVLDAAEMKKRAKMASIQGKKLKRKRNRKRAKMVAKLPT